MQKIIEKKNIFYSLSFNYILLFLIVFGICIPNYFYAYAAVKFLIKPKGLDFTTSVNTV